MDPWITNLLVSLASIAIGGTFVYLDWKCDVKQDNPYSKKKKYKKRP